MSSRYNFRPHAARVEEPRMRGHVKRLHNGLVSLHHTPSRLAHVAQRNAAISPLLRLPAELRSKVFKYALSSTVIRPQGDRYWKRRPQPWKAIITVMGLTPSSPLHPNHWTAAFALPRVCRQIYSETATLVYSGNNFVLPDVRHAEWYAARVEAQLDANKVVTVQTANTGLKICDYPRLQTIVTYNKGIDSLVRTRISPEVRQDVEFVIEDMKLYYKE